MIYLKNKLNISETFNLKSKNNSNNKAEQNSYLFPNLSTMLNRVNLVFIKS